MLTGAESFSVVINEDDEGELDFQIDINSVSVEHLYKVCYTICKKIEEGSLKPEVRPLNWQGYDNLS